MMITIFFMIMIMVIKTIICRVLQESPIAYGLHPNAEIGYRFAQVRALERGCIPCYTYIHTNSAQLCVPSASAICRVRLRFSIAPVMAQQ
jgi:hypothetical protein